MASYVFSANPNVVFNPSVDILQIDGTVTASGLSVQQVGSNVVLTNGTNTATLQNVLLEQLTGIGGINSTVTGTPNFTNVTFSNGSTLIIGDNDVALTNDAAANTPTATALGDQLQGLAGNDTLNGLGGSDLIYGNQGNDVVNTTGVAAAGNDTVFGGQGNDNVDYSAATTSGRVTAYGNLGDDNMTGGSGNDLLFGGQGNDVLNSSGGNDSFVGGLGLDNIFGGAGNDTILAGDNEDSVNAGAGRNLIYGNQGDDNITGSAGSTDTVFGGQNSDIINYSALAAANAVLVYGNLGIDSITGGAGNDTLFGGQDNDSLIGGLSGDTMAGGLGADRFFEVISDANPANTTSGLTTASSDTISDFLTGTDRLVIGLNATAPAAATGAIYREYTDATVTTAEQAATSFNNSGLATINYTFIAGATDGFLVIDSNQGGAADGVIKLTGITSLAGFDFTDITAN